MAFGFLIPTRYEVLYERAISSGTYDPPPLPKLYYGIPCRFLPNPSDQPKHYRGIDREPLWALSHEDADGFLATADKPRVADQAMDFLWRVQIATGRDDGWLTSAEDTVKAWEMLGNPSFDHRTGGEGI